MKTDSIRFSNKFVAFLVGMLLVGFLSGCSFTQSVAGKAASFAVGTYCKIPNKTVGRKTIRAQFNKVVSPHTVTVVCSGD